jgi:microcin C transport system substrate-binding protein
LLRHPLFPLLTRRAALLTGAGGLALLASRQSAAAAPTGETESHGVSIFGELEQPADFKYFPYVNPAAPKGGTLSLQPTTNSNGSFDSFNPFILRGNPAAGALGIYDSLMTGSLDEPDVGYGLVAHKMRVSADKRTYTFFLRKEARFHDGSMLTAHDAAFSLNILKTEGSPIYAISLSELVSAVAEADDVLVVTLSEKRSRNLPLIIATTPILSKAYYATHKFNETSLEPPLGSGAYKIGPFDPGRYVSLVRVPDYWAQDLPVNVGQNNFDVIRYEYYGDQNVSFEAFKSGAISLHEEYISANWAKGYDFPAFKEGRVKRELIPDHSISGIQAWYFNTRRAKFKDPRIREALGYAFDFEWSNHNLFFDAYTRTTSYFENSDLKAEGPPSAAELALLEPFRDRLPKEVFGDPIRPPVSDGSGQDRNLLRKATDLLLAAGCTRKDGALRLPDGQPFAFEILEYNSSLERLTQPFIKNLKLIGVNATLRFVDSAQYKRRLDDFDFDVMSANWRMTYSPGDDLRAFISAGAASTAGSQNYAGVVDPVVDALIDVASHANSRAELQTAIRALDRVLLAGRYWIPMYGLHAHRLAFWDVFGRPERAPKFDPGVSSCWWWDEEKAKKIHFGGR